MHELASDSEAGLTLLGPVFALLISALIVVLLLHRLRASPVLGYLVAGVLIGPHGLGVIRQVDDIRLLAELGVVFLLFLIGLELSLERLRSMARFVFGLGAAQVAASAAVLGLAAWLLGSPPAAALVLGAALALSSTAVVLQLLAERGEIAGRVGRVSFSILLFQDLAVVPLLVVLGTAWITQSTGLSMALGAFLAGLALSGTEYRHQVEADIKPFKGLLLGLFFITVGMSIDLSLVAGQAAWLVVAVAGLIAVKALVIVPLCRAFGLPLAAALRTGLLLGEGGEFAFVVIAAAMQAGVLAVPVGQFALALTGLSILLTPGLAWAGATLAPLLESRAAAQSMGPDRLAGEPLEGHVVIAGFGRVGETVARLLDEQKVPYIAVDLDPIRVGACRARGGAAVFGDASRLDVLEQLGAARAAAAIVTLNDPDAARRAVAALRQRWPELKIFARARDSAHGGELAALGAADVVQETLESSLTLARHALLAIGAPGIAAEHLDTAARTGEQGAD